MKPSISVIIPTFNRPRLVQEAIESVRSQRAAADFNVIVIDDGSTRDTEEALRRYRDEIRYVRQENRGLNAARNHALRLARGEYIALLDDDDVWLPFKTSVQLAALARFPQAAFVHSNFCIWKPETNERRPDGIRSWFPRPFAWDEMYSDRTDVACDAPEASHVQAYFGDTYRWALYAPMVLPSAAIIRRAALDDDLRFPEFDSTCGDWDFFARLSHRHGGVFLPLETTLNRSHEDPWRLTRIEGSIQLRRRIALIRRLWRADPEFMSTYRVEVDRTEADCLRKLAKRLLLNADSAGARGALGELRRLGPMMRQARDLLLWALAFAPFPGGVAGLLRSMRTAAGRSAS